MSAYHSRRAGHSPTASVRQTMTAHVGAVRAPARAVAAAAVARDVHDRAQAVVGGAQVQPLDAVGDRELGQPTRRARAEPRGEARRRARAEGPAALGARRHRPAGGAAGEQRVGGGGDLVDRRGGEDGRELAADGAYRLEVGGGYAPRPPPGGGEGGVGGRGGGGAGRAGGRRARSATDTSFSGGSVGRGRVLTSAAASSAQAATSSGRRSALTPSGYARSAS